MDDAKHETGTGYEQVITKAAANLAGHDWRQFGPTLVCHSCPFEHSQFIPPNLRYRGLDDHGLPVLETIT